MSSTATLSDSSVGSSKQSTHKTLALIGHPNVGKSVIFHALTGKYVTVSNFPGTTVDISRGIGNINGADWVVLDSPGVFSLQPRTDDERVSRDLLLETKLDVVIQVADAKNLSKSLHLTLELAEFGCPMVLALNMADESQDRGIQIDVKRLSQILGIPVVETVAITGDGIAEVKKLIEKAALPKIGPRYDRQVLKSLERFESHFQLNGHLQPAPGTRAIAVALFGRDKSALAHAAPRIKTGELGQLETAIAETDKRFTRPPEMFLFESKQVVVQEILGEVFHVERSGSRTFLGKLGLWCMRPFPGYLIALGTLWLMYEFVGVFGAGTLVGYLEENLFGNIINPLATRLVNAAIPIPLIQEALVGEYGAITMAITYALALILPIVSTFFLFFGILEDSGYLPRLAVMMDRIFRLMGLNGRAVLPMVLGLGCDTMATVTTRILDTKKEKLITSLLLTLAVPCSAQLAAILGMAAGVSGKVLIIWFGVVMLTMMLVGWGAAQVIPGARAPFLTELPPLRIPKLSNIYKKVKARLKWYTKEVIPLFLVATFVLFVLDKIKLLDWMEKVFAPVVVGLLGLPAKASEAFLVGFFRRDYGGAGFFKLAQEGLLTPHQVAVSMVVITLFMPCVAHVLVTFKERGLKATILITGFTLAFALAVGGLVNWALTVVPIL